MLFFRYLAVLALVAVSFAQDDDYYDEPIRPRPAPARIQPGYSGPSKGPAPTPVPILKQINRHNEDGSYTYGYESADGTFKIETKLPTGEVKGKYGYVDDTGKVRVVEYGATKYGFDPAGEGITVPPPTLVNENPEPEEEDNFDSAPPRGAPVKNYPAPRPRPRPQPQPVREFENYSPPQQFEPAPAPVPARARVSGAAPSGIESLSFDFGPPSRPSKSFAPARTFAPAPAPKPRPAPIQYAQPSSIEDDYEAAPAPRPAPRIVYADPAPLSSRAQPRPAPQFAPAARPPPPSFGPGPVAPRPRPVPKIPTAGPGGILDQLSRDYALPDAGSQPLHDISFGYY